MTEYDKGANDGFWLGVAVGVGCMVSFVVLVKSCF